MRPSRTFLSGAPLPERLRGFQDAANLDDDNMWPVSYALLKWSPVVEKKVVELVSSAIS